MTECAQDLGDEENDLVCKMRDLSTFVKRPQVSVGHVFMGCGRPCADIHNCNEGAKDCPEKETPQASVHEICLRRKNIVKNFSQITSFSGINCLRYRVQDERRRLYS